GGVVASGDALDEPVELGELLACHGSHLGVLTGGVGLHLEHERVAVAAEVEVGLAHGEEDVAPRIGRGSLLEHLQDAPIATADRLEEELLLRPEKAEEIGLGDAGAASDVLRRSAVKTAARELDHGRLEDLLAA